MSHANTCRTCGAEPYHPCRNRHGGEMTRSHWGRPHYTDRRTRPAPPARPKSAERAEPVTRWYQRVDADEVREYEARRFGD